MLMHHYSPCVNAIIDCAISVSYNPSDRKISQTEMDSAATTDSESLSAIESLPAELIAEILDYTPQSVFILRLVKSFE